MSYETARVIVWFLVGSAVLVLGRFLAEKVIDRCSDAVVGRLVCGGAIALALGLGFTIAHAVCVYATGSPK